MREAAQQTFPNYHIDHMSKPKPNEKTQTPNQKIKEGRGEGDPERERDKWYAAGQLAAWGTHDLVSAFPGVRKATEIPAIATDS